MGATVNIVPYKAASKVVNFWRVNQLVLKTPQILLFAWNILKNLTEAEIKKKPQNTGDVAIFLRLSLHGELKCQFK